MDGADPSDSFVVLFREYAAFGATAAGGLCRALGMAKSGEGPFPEHAVDFFTV